MLAVGDGVGVGAPGDVGVAEGTGVGVLVAGGLVAPGGTVTCEPPLQPVTSATLASPKVTAMVRNT